jgi:hypothetical protein
MFHQLHQPAYFNGVPAVAGPFNNRLCSASTLTATVGAYDPLVQIISMDKVRKHDAF